MPSSADHCSAIAAKRSSLPPAMRGPFVFSHAWGPSTRQALMLTAAASPQANILTFFRRDAYTHVYAKEFDMARNKTVSLPPNDTNMYRTQRLPQIHNPPHFKI